MVESTRAIVLHKTNYAESSIVVQLYTFHFGRISILVHGAKKKKSRNRIALFEPLSILDISGNFKNTDKLIRLSEVSISFPFQEIHSKITKSVIALFLSEVVHKSIKESLPETDLYLFLENALMHLEKTDRSISNFHLVFLLELTRFLGFYPFKSEGKYFSINDGVFLNNIPPSGLYLKEDEKAVFYSLLNIRVTNCFSILLNSAQRKQALQSVLDYYKVHIPNMGEVKSHRVLETIFH